jgi:hypothetical protein
VTDRWGGESWGGDRAEPSTGLGPGGCASPVSTALPHTLLSTLEANLAALARTSPGVAARLRAVSPRSDAAFFPTDDGVLGCEVGFGVGVQALASRRRPLAEAGKLIDTVDLTGAAVFAVAGFGLGYHAVELSRRVGRTGIVLVHEPDLALLRAVLERVDHSAVFREANLAFVEHPDDPAELSVLLQGGEGLVAVGVGLVDHPSSRQRLGAAGKAFFESVTSVVDGLKMSILTTLVQSRVTLQNLTQNLGAYVRSPGVADLAGVCAGRAAVVVAAGPSLERNVDLLARPGVRERVVIVAAQTVLKTLLARGIRPHFVTALDFSELSRRFYEGLSARDVEGVTLVLDAKVNPAVVDAYPGAVRVMGDRHLDALLGPELGRDRGVLRAGATVAHLSYYLARHLGCDPVALIGQDLGFTDGQYYAAGAAVHSVWAPELNEFNTLETMEWQRIVRMGRHLRRASDHAGRPIFTDEQMATYLAQFERDFRVDAEKGLTTIDASEGGVRKRHTRALPLEEFLSRHGASGLPTLSLPPTPPAPRVAVDRVDERVRGVRAGAWRVADLSRKALAALEEMLEHHADQARVNRCITRVEALRDKATVEDPAYGLSQLLNQVGGFNRLKADREITLEHALAPMERQKRQIRRDIENVRSLAEAAEQLARLLDAASASLNGAPKLTRDDQPGAAGAAASAGAERRVGDVWAVIPVDFDRSVFGLERSLETCPLGPEGPTLLGMTLARLARMKTLAGAVLVSTDEARCRRLAAETPAGLRLDFAVIDRPVLRDRREGVGAARAFARECWRGGVAGMTVFDEVYDPAVVKAAMARVDAAAAYLVGPDWCLVDPALGDAVVERFVSSNGERRVTFTQAPPGLCGLVIARSLAGEIAAAEHGAGHLATLGAMLGYVPGAPVPDLIATPACAAIDPLVRSHAWRFIADSPLHADAIAFLAQRLGSSWDAAPSSALVAALHAAPPSVWRAPAPAHVRLEGDGLDAGLVAKIVERTLVLRPDAGFTLAWAGAASVELTRAAALAGARALHVRGRDIDARAHVDAGATIVSLEADEPPGDALAAVRELRALRGAALAPAWVVGRFVRADERVGEVEGFYERWIRATGAAVIDPPRERASAARITPLPVPAPALARARRSVMSVIGPGLVPLGARGAGRASIVADLRRDDVGEAWAKVLDARASSPTIEPWAAEF